MKRLKTNGAIALLLGASILLGSIGHVVGRGGAEAYTAPDLLLTQGQARYDLCDGIKYNKKYELSVWDDGGFDINTPGNYTVEYMLTPAGTVQEPKETIPPKNPAGGQGAADPKETTGGKETAASKESTEAQETTAPKETTGTQESPSSQESTGTQESPSSQESTGTQESPSSQESAGTQESSSSQESAGTQESASSQESAGTQESASSQESAGTQESASSQESAGTQESASSQENAGVQEPASSQGNAGAQNTASGNSGSQDSASAQDNSGSQNSSASQDSAGAPEPGSQEQNNTSDSADTMKAQGRLTAPAALRMSNDRIILKEEAPAAETPASISAQAETTAPAQTSAASETAAPASHVTTVTTAPASHVTTESTGITPGEATSSQADSSSDEIFFTRTVVVKAAVQYSDVRYDIDTQPDLFKGMVYDKRHYSLSIMDDGGFNSSRIGEYHIIYSLVNTDSGDKVADLDRYIWITAAGAAFDAPQLQLRINEQDYDLQSGITYDSSKYALTTVVPDSIDTSHPGEQRVMFYMTLRAEDSQAQKATPAQADYALTGELPSQETVSDDGADEGSDSWTYVESDLTTGPGTVPKPTEAPGPGTVLQTPAQPAQDQSAALESDTDAQSAESAQPGQSAEAAQPEQSAGDAGSAAVSPEESSQAGETDGPEQSSVSLVTDISKAESFVTQPVVAVFGRNVNVTDGPVVVIDAPPLVIVPGTEAQHDLLEGVTAEDENGNPVEFQVTNRIQLDQAAERAASGDENPVIPGVAEFLASVKAGHTTTIETGPKQPGATASDAAVQDGNGPSIQNGSGSAVQDGSDTAAQDENVPAAQNGQLPSTVTADVPLSQNGLSGFAQNGAADQAGASTQNGEPVQSGGSTQAAPLIPESPALPEDLPEGTYAVLLSAEHPVTGEVFTTARTVKVGGEEKPEDPNWGTIDPQNNTYNLHTGTNEIDLDKYTPKAGFFVTAGSDGTIINLKGGNADTPATIPCSKVQRSPITLAPAANLTLNVTDGSNIILSGLDAEDGENPADHLSWKMAEPGGCGVQLQRKDMGAPTYGTVTINTLGSGKIELKGGDAGRGGAPTVVMENGKEVVVGGGSGGGGAGAGVGGLGSYGGPGGSAGAPNGSDEGRGGPNKPENNKVIFQHDGATVTNPADAHITVINGKVKGPSPTERKGGAAPGGGGFPASAETKQLRTSWIDPIPESPKYWGGYGGGGGGYGADANNLGGFGMGVSGVDAQGNPILRYPGLRVETTGNGGEGGTSWYWYNSHTTVMVSAVGKEEVIWQTSIASAINEIKRDIEESGSKRQDYTITLLDDYTLTAGDLAALNGFSYNKPNISLTLTGQNKDQENTIHTLMAPANGAALQLPKSTYSINTCTFTIKDIKLARNSSDTAKGIPFTINAGGSKLTVDNVVSAQDWKLEGGDGTSTKADLTVSGNLKTCSIFGTTGTGGGSSLTIAGGKATVKQIYDCDVVNVPGNTSLELVQDMWLNRNQAVGDIKLGANSTLTLSEAGNNAQSITTTGDGATLKLAKTSNGIADLILKGPNPAALSAHPIKLVNTTPGTTWADGGNLIRFVNAKGAARTEDYINGFGNNMLVRGDASTGMVQLWTPKVRLDYPDGTSEPCATLGEAMTKVKADNVPALKTGTYTLTFLQEQDYYATTQDLDALQAATGLSGAATVVITGKDAKNPSAPIRRFAATTLQLPLRMSNENGATFKFENMVLSGSGVIAANGSKLIMGEGISSSNMYTLVGGRYMQDRDDGPDAGDTWIEAYSGDYDMIIGGNFLSSSGYGNLPGYNHTHNFNTTITMGGNSTAGSLIGCDEVSLAGNMTVCRNGNSNITIQDRAAARNLIANSDFFSMSGKGNHTVADSVRGGSSTVLLKDNAWAQAMYSSRVTDDTGITTTENFDSANTRLTLDVRMLPNVDTVQGFEKISMAPNTDTYVHTLGLGHAAGEAGYKYPQWDFQGNAKLSVSKPSAAGSFHITGAGNTLSLPRSKDGKAPLTMVGNEANVQDNGAQLSISYSDGSNPVNQDKLIHYNTPAYADAGQYASGFGPTWGVRADAVTGDVYLEEGSIRLDYPLASHKPSERYGTLGKAMEVIKADNTPVLREGVYTLTILQSDYTLTAADVQGFTAATGMSPNATVVLTGGTDPAKKLTLHADLALPKGSAGETGAAFELNNLTFAGTTARKIIANGSKLTMGEDLTMENSDTLVLVGGAADNVQNLTFQGNTWLEVKSGSYSNIFGGNFNTSGSLNPASTVNGTTTVNISGTAAANRVCGGSYIYQNIGGGAQVTQNGGRTVTLSGNVNVANVAAGSYCDGTPLSIDKTSDGSKSEVILDGVRVSRVTASDSVNGRGGYASGRGNVVVTVNGTVRVTDALGDFETLQLTNGSVLETHLQRVFNSVINPAMLVDFQGNARLTLTGAKNQAGRFKITGTGNILTIPQTGAAEAPLTLDGSEANECVGGAKLQLAYPDGTSVNAGDKLLYFNPTKKNANSADYVSTIGGMAVLSNSVSGYVYAGNTVTVQKDGAGEPLTYYANLAEAMKAIGGQKGVYTVTFRKANYVLTKEDGMALAMYGGNTDKITFTSTFTTTMEDPLEANEAVGQKVTRELLVGYGTTPSDPKSDLYLNSQDTVVENIRFKYLQEGCSLYSNGHTLLIGSGVDILSDSGYFPTLYGGAKDHPVGKTDMTIQSGKYNDIYGGGQMANATVTGNAIVRFGGSAEAVGTIYGGGNAGAVTGQASLEITGGKVSAVSEGGKNIVVGGGRTGNAGGVRIAISGGSADGTIEIAGCDQGNVLGNVDISITERPGGAPPKAALGNIYGASLDTGRPAGAVTGDIDITITNGKDYGAIHGGKSQMSPGDNKAATITFKGGTIKVADLMDFDILNLGNPDITEAEKANLFLTGKLQGDGGTLNFWDGSFLTLQGTSRARADLIIGDIHTDNTSPRSHLHMYKGPETAGSNSAVSIPLNITGMNTSDPDDLLQVGEYGPGGSGEADKVGHEGDRLLVFTQPQYAFVKQYVSDLPGSSIVPSATEEGVLVVGRSVTPTVALSGVRHTQADGSTVTTADTADLNQETVKTLTFTIKSFDPVHTDQPGGKITGGYVDNNPKEETNWGQGLTDNIPAGATAITVMAPATGTDQTLWTGTATMGIKPTELNPPAPQKPVCYYAHVRDASNNCQTTLLDVNSPVQTADASLSMDGQGNYTVTAHLTDALPAVEGYTKVGLYQTAWAVGDLNDPVPAGRDEALAAIMTVGPGTQLQGVYTQPQPMLDTYDYEFQVPADKLVGDLSKKAVYVYAKDALGNTSMYVIPLNDNIMKIDVPLWAGTVAVRGPQPYLISPDLYLVNQSVKPVKAEIIGTEIPQGQSTAEGKLELTANMGPSWTKNQLCLAIQPLVASRDQSYFRPVVSITQAQPLDLGIMPGSGSPNHGVGFSFGAVYDSENIERTSGWSQCTLTYRFTLAPTPPTGQ